MHDSTPIPAAQLVATDMREVDAVIRRRLTSDVALVNQIGEYIIGAGGKRMRPMLVIMFARALGFRGAEHHRFREALHGARRQGHRPHRKHAL